MLWGAVLGGGAVAYIDPVNGPKTLQPHQPVPGDVVHEQILAAEKCLPKPLGLRLLLHVRRARQERVLAHLPLGGPVDGQGDDVAKQGGAQRDLAVARVRGLGHLAAGEELADAELDVAAQLDGPAHVDHGAGLGLDQPPLGDINGKDGVGVPVGDLVAAAGEGAVAGYGQCAGS